MASGIEVSDQCISTFRQLKLGKQFKYILFALNDDLSEIVVDKTSDASSSSYDAFVEDLPRDQCRWAVYDFEFEKEDGGKRNRLCFVSWSPEKAKIKDKMLFASSHEAFKHRLDGVAFEIQATGRSEISYETMLAKGQTSTH